MLVVAFETSSAVGSVAVARALSPSGRGQGEGGSGQAPVIVEERLFTKGLHHGANIVPTIDAIFEAHKLDRSEVGLVAVSSGPGSYTGIRVGIASGKALAFALGAPMIGVPAPDCVIRNLPPKGKAAVIIDARRGQFYVTPYEAKAGQWDPSAPHRSLDVAAAAAVLSPDTLLAGEGVQAFLAASKGNWPAASDEAGIPHSRFTALLAFERLASGAPDELLALEPLYLRPTEAEETWRKKHGSSS